MEPEGSLPCSQEPATCPYPEPNESNPHPQTLFPEDGIYLQVHTALQPQRPISTILSLHVK
jgi:hypothetical protein